MCALETVTFEDLAASTTFAEFSLIMQRLVGMPVGLNDPTVTKALDLDAGRQNSALCALIRAIPEGKARCLACDREHIAQVVRARTAIKYRCHAGLVDMAAPVLHHGTPVAIITCGQSLPNPPNAGELAHIQRCLAALPLSPVAIRDAYAATPYIDDSRLAIVLKLLAFFAEHLCDVTQRLRELERHPGAISRAQAYLAAHYLEALTLADVAGQVGLSASYFSAQFHQATGMTFTSYLQQLRVAHACRLLRETTHTITEIALASGFNCPSQFTRVFTRCQGCTAGQYRRMHAQAAEPALGEVV
jgi:AraC-like DNA-binding protein